MHPADEIAKALSQARGILASVVNCFDRPEAKFATASTYIAEAVIAAEEILGKANLHLATLFEDYDLSISNASTEYGVTADVTEEDEAAPEPDLPENYLPASFGLFGRHPSVTHLANKLETIVDTLPRAPEPLRPEQLVEQPAQSYAELLEKLTAMADSAAFHTGEGDSTLLPVLQSLRNDVIRMRSVA